jgi:hypothetical protein
VVLAKNDDVVEALARWCNPKCVKSGRS